MKKIIYFLTAAFVLSTAPAFAHCGMCPMSMKGSSDDYVSKKVEKLTAELNLSDDQAAQIKTLITEKVEKKKAIKEDKMNKIEALQEEYSGKISAVLDDEQKAKYETLKADWGKDKMKMHGHPAADMDDESGSDS